MKVHRKILLFSALLGLGLTTGCKKHDVNPQKTSALLPPGGDKGEKAYLPVRMGTGGSKMMFSYTADHSLSKIEYANGNSTVISYNTAGKPLVLLRYQGSKAVFSTEFQLDKNGMVTRGDQFSIKNGNYDATGSYTVTYNPAGQPAGISYYDANEKLTGTQQKNYTMAGNLINEESTLADLNTDYLYDDQKGLFKNVNYTWLLAVEKENSLFLSGINNIKTCVYPLKTSNNLVFNYIYNADKYPKTVTSVVNGETFSSTVTYQAIE